MERAERAGEGRLGEDDVCAIGHDTRPWSRDCGGSHVNITVTTP
jgi:hypothetical protein